MKKTAKKRAAAPETAGTSISRDRGETTFTLPARVRDRGLSMTMDIATAKASDVEVLGEVESRVAMSMPGGVLVQVSWKRNGESFWRTYHFNVEAMIRAAIEKTIEIERAEGDV